MVQAAWETVRNGRSVTTQAEESEAQRLLRGLKALGRPEYSIVHTLSSRADGLFEDLCTAPELRQWMAALPLRGLPQIGAVVRAALDGRDESDPETLVYEQISRDWTGLPGRDRYVAAHLYTRCLREAARLT